MRGQRPTSARRAPRDDRKKAWPGLDPGWAPGLRHVMPASHLSMFLSTGRRAKSKRSMFLVLCLRRRVHSRHCTHGRFPASGKITGKSFEIGHRVAGSSGEIGGKQCLAVEIPADSNREFFAPNSEFVLRNREFLLSLPPTAGFRARAAARGSRHSITSSARASKLGGTSRPSALAVLRLTTSSYLVGVCTGRSAGFSPLRMRSA